MYLYKFLYIWNLLVKLEMLMPFLRIFHHYKKYEFQAGGLDDFPLVARTILNHFEIGNVGINLYCHMEVHEKF